jgi:hypothetical protein
MKAATAASKLGILVGAAPKEFQESMITRAELDALRSDPPSWLTELRRNGPFPREVVAAKLGVSKSGLLRGGITEPLDAAQIGILLADPPAWLVRERETHRGVIAEAERVREQRSRERS